MKKLSRILCLLLVLVLATAAIPAMAEEDKVELTIAICKSANDTLESFADKHFLAKAEEETGIHINWIEYVDGWHFDALTALLAGDEKDMPDAIMIGYDMYDFMIVENPSLYIPLNDLFPEYCPELYAFYEENVPGWRNYLTYPDGNIYGLMSGALINDSNLTGGVPFINQKWLDNLGLQMPTTMDELYDVLVAFRDQDADGDGNTDNEIPFDFCEKGSMFKIANLASMFGLTKNNYGIKNGEVVGNVNNEAYRSYLETVHQWCEEGLINIEGLAQTTEQYYAHLDALQVGVFWGWAPYSYINSEAKLDYVPMGLVAADGYTPALAPNAGINAHRNGFVLTRGCENVEAALTWWEYVSKKENARFFYRGEEGLMWTLNEKDEMIGRTPTDDELKALGYDALLGNTNDTTLGNYIGYNNFHPLLLKAVCPDMTNVTENLTVRQIAVESVKEYLETPMVQGIVPSEAQEQLNLATDGLNNVIIAYAADAIMNGVTDESWENYLADLSTYGYDFYIEWYGNYFNGTL